MTRLAKIVLRSVQTTQFDTFNVCLHGNNFEKKSDEIKAPNNSQPTVTC